MTRMRRVRTPQGVVRLHSFFGAGTARVRLICIVLFVAVPLPYTVVHLVRAGLGHELVAPLFFFAGLCLFVFLQLRQQPKIYGSDAGLELEWPWGTTRHLAWNDVVDVQQVSLTRLAGVAFRLGLRHGSITIQARDDFPERIYQLKLTQPVH